MESNKKTLDLEIREIGAGFVEVVDKADGKIIENIAMGTDGNNVSIKYGEHGKRIGIELLIPVRHRARITPVKNPNVR